MNHEMVCLMWIVKFVTNTVECVKLVQHQFSLFEDFARTHYLIDITDGLQSDRKSAKNTSSKGFHRLRYFGMKLIIFGNCSTIRKLKIDQNRFLNNFILFQGTRPFMRFVIRLNVYHIRLEERIGTFSMMKVVFYHRNMWAKLHWVSLHALKTNSTVGMEIVLICRKNAMGPTIAWISRMNSNVAK